MLLFLQSFFFFPPFFFCFFTFLFVGIRIIFGEIDLPGENIFSHIILSALRCFFFPAHMCAPVSSLSRDKYVRPKTCASVMHSFNRFLSSFLFQIFFFYKSSSVLHFSTFNSFTFIFYLNSILSFSPSAPFSYLYTFLSLPLHLLFVSIYYTCLFQPFSYIFLSMTTL